MTTRGVVAIAVVVVAAADAADATAAPPTTLRRARLRVCGGGLRAPAPRRGTICRLCKESMLVALGARALGFSRVRACVCLRSDKRLVVVVVVVVVVSRDGCLCLSEFCGSIRVVSDRIV